MNIIETIRKHILDVGENPVKSIWRSSGGNRDKAFSIIKKTLVHYGCVPSDMDIDEALAGDGVEMEWTS